MNIVYALGLATAIASSQSLHAQSCSGGADGGMDATGSQCNAHHTVVALATAPAAIPPVELSGANWSGRARPLAIRLSKYSLPHFRPVTLATPARRSATAVVAPPTTVSSDGTPTATCSGGSGDGGRDATGNQCNE